RKGDGGFVKTERDAPAPALPGDGEYLLGGMMGEDILEGPGPGGLELRDAAFAGKVAPDGADEQEDAVRVKVEHRYGFAGDRVYVEVRVRVIFRYAPLFAAVHTTVPILVFRDLAGPFTITAFHEY